MLLLQLKLRHILVTARSIFRRSSISARFDASEAVKISVVQSGGGNGGISALCYANRATPLPPSPLPRMISLNLLENVIIAAAQSTLLLWDVRTRSYPKLKIDTSHAVRYLKVSFQVSLVYATVHPRRRRRRCGGKSKRQRRAVGRTGADERHFRRVAHRVEAEACSTFRQSLFCSCPLDNLTEADGF